MQHANGRSALGIVNERYPVVQLGHWDFAADRGQGKHAPAARPIQPTFPQVLGLLGAILRLGEARRTEFGRNRSGRAQTAALFAG